MEREKLEYLRDVVMPHVRKMPTIEDWNNDDDDTLSLDSAVLNFDEYQEYGRETSKPVSDAFDCGLEGCLAGWYRWLAIRDRKIEDWELSDFQYDELAYHFGIDEKDAIRLFTSSGSGIETVKNAGHETRRVLAARATYLDELLAE